MADGNSSGGQLAAVVIWPGVGGRACAALTRAIFLVRMNAICNVFSAPRCDRKVAGSEGWRGAGYR